MGEMAIKTKIFPTPDAVRAVVRQRVDQIVEQALCSGKLRCDFSIEDAWVTADVVDDLKNAGWEVTAIQNGGSVSLEFSEKKN